MGIKLLNASLSPTIPYYHHVRGDSGGGSSLEPPDAWRHANPSHSSTPDVCGVSCIDIYVYISPAALQMELSSAGLQILQAKA